MLRITWKVFSKGEESKKNFQYILHTPKNRIFNTYLTYLNGKNVTSTFKCEYKLILSKVHYFFAVFFSSSESRAKSKHLQNYAHKSFNTFPWAWTLDNPLLGCICHAGHRQISPLQGRSCCVPSVLSHFAPDSFLIAGAVLHILCPLFTHFMFGGVGNWGSTHKKIFKVN